MARYWNNKGKILLSPKFLAFYFILCTGIFLCWMLYPGRANSGPYLNSAHGSSYGVNRPRTAGFGYAIGNCAHCHEQHASIGGSVITAQDYLLFYGNVITICDGVCYRCHNATGAEMQVNNYLYSISFGGRSPLAFPGIYDHFCNVLCTYALGVQCGSRHSLAQIYNVIKNNGQGWGYGSDPTPCEACHNVHMSQRIGAKQYHGPYNPSKSPIQRVTEHNNPTKRLNLWGDETTERMSYYIQINGGYYQAPYYGNTSGTMFEPSGNSTPSDGSDLPYYVTFCMDCHKYAQYDPEQSAMFPDVKAINWGLGGDVHGGRAANKPGDTQGYLRPPYSDGNAYNYVLSCTDCHEPHGSPNRQLLLRRYVNGEPVAAEDSDLYCEIIYSEGRAFCERCHFVAADHGPTSIKCFGCHSHNGAPEF